MKIKKGDLVRVLSGKDKGTEGHVMAVDAENGRITVLETSDRVSLAPHRVQQHHAIWTQDRLVASFSGFNRLNHRKQFDRETCPPAVAGQSSLVIHRL